MIVFICLIIALLAEIAVLVYLIGFKPYMRVDSWGEPDMDEACGMGCVILMGIIAMLVAIVLTLMAIGVVLNG